MGHQRAASDGRNQKLDKKTSGQTFLERIQAVSLIVRHLICLLSPQETQSMSKNNEEKDVVPGVQHVHSFTSGVLLSKISVGDLFLSSFVFQEDFWYSFWSDKYVKEREKKKL